VFAVIADRQHEFVFDRVVQKLHMQAHRRHHKLWVRIKKSTCPSGPPKCRRAPLQPARVAYTVLDVGDTLT